MKSIALALILLSCTTALAQGCFEKCRDHLSSPLREKENIEARFAQSERVLQGLVGCGAPDFNVTTIEGKKLSLAELKGKIVVINFWFKACAPCIAELPALNRLVNDYKNRDVVFIAFGRDSDAAIKELMETNPFNYQLVSREYDVSENYCVISGWPMNILIDKKGKVRHIKSGGKIDTSAQTEAYGAMKPLIDKWLSK